MRFVGLLAWAVATTAAGATSSLDIADLMAKLSAVDVSVVTFEETRHFAVMSAPVVRRGTLRYERPDRLEMQVVTPFPETVEIAGSRIRIESPDGRREWSLAAQPVALAWIEAIRASLAGDVATLARLFRITLTGTSASWRLHLEPLDARVATTLAHVEVRGREAQLSTIEIVDRQGDRVVIKLEPVQRRPQ